MLVSKYIGWFSNRTEESVDDGARELNNCLDRWQSGKLDTGSRVQSFPRAFPSLTDVLTFSVCCYISLIDRNALAIKEAARGTLK